MSKCIREQLTTTSLHTIHVNEFHKHYTEEQFTGLGSLVKPSYHECLTSSMFFLGLQNIRARGSHYSHTFFVRLRN